MGNLKNEHLVLMNIEYMRLPWWMIWFWIGLEMVGLEKEMEVDH